MKSPFTAHPPSFDATFINDTIQRAFSAAGLDTSSGAMAHVSETIREALASSGLGGSINASAVDDSIIDVTARVIDPTPASRRDSSGEPALIAPASSGSFETLEFSSAFGSRTYRLYVPARAASQAPPLIVMLHGCTQSAQDFAAGTQMNRLAQEHGFLVLYPEQSANANVSRCWNWFKPQDQVRDAGEPALLAGLAREVASSHHADPRRIFVAGLSAGAAMAVVLGQTYPDLFAGVGAHSGLPYGSASDVGSAMAAMKDGRGRSGFAVGSSRPSTLQRESSRAVPTIVFHGDRDHTVQHANGARIVDQAVSAFSAERQGPLRSTTQRATSTGGRSYSRTVYADHDGTPVIESWTVHGAGHAWSGGRATGSYTDGAGPDASAEMVRFFFRQKRAGSA